MRIVFFGAGGDFALFPLQAMAARHEIIAVVRPAPRTALRALARRGARALGLRPRDPLDPWLRREGYRVLTARSARDPALLTSVRCLKPDLICIATLPWLLPSTLLEVSPLGTLNLHVSLLPRHRGPNPFFWTYYHGDLETGVTVHQATARADAGPIFRRVAIPLPRGFNINPLHTQLARLGADELVTVVDALERGEVSPTAQDESAATAAPRVPKGASMARLEEWDVSQVWHFLAGLVPHFREPLLDTRGRNVRYNGVGSYERGDSVQPPGTVVPTRGGWLLHCRGGSVTLVS